MKNKTCEIYMNEIVMEKELWRKDMKNLSLQIETNKRPKNENEWMNSIHYYNSWFFQLGFLVQKYSKVTCVKKSPYQFGQVFLAMSNMIG
jgi:hypothetical protein